MPTEATVLVVDDEADVREILEEYLSRHGFRVLTADGGPAMRALLAEHAPHVVLLDVGLPGEDGLSLARYVREQLDVGIIMISGAGDTVDRVVGLEVGADDYVVKPFEPREVLARVRSVLRRYQRESAAEAPASVPSKSRRVAFGIGTLDLDACQLLGPDGAEIPLTPMELELLRVFAERPNRPLSRDQLMSLTRNREWDPFDRSIDIRIARLRKKIEANPEKPQTLKTVRGIGYKFVPAEAARPG